MSFGLSLDFTSFLRLIDASQYLAKLILEDVANFGTVLLRGGVLHLSGTQRDPQHNVAVL